ncbi:MAG: hypothetical protein ACJ77K_14890 [Bacteroidia bacterium]
MLKKIISACIFILMFSLSGASQTPHISGTVRLDISKGLFQCDLEISDLPRISGYSVLLNSGFNIKYFRNTGDTKNYYFERYYNDKQSFEAFQYYFPSNDRRSRFLPDAFRISYTGAFPVIGDTAKMSSDDWKGNIAFNDRYLRATEQSVWYPILYDTLNDVTYDNVTYDLQIICETPETIYLNGSAPQKSAAANFTSTVPFPLFLFIGNYGFEKNKETYFLNAGLSGEQESELSSWCRKIMGYYEKELGIPYGVPVSFIDAEPVCKDRSWMFVTYPSIVSVGRPPYTLSGLFRKDKPELRDSAMINYYSHELGHYYFGTYLVPNAELKWLFLEGTTEYLSLQTSRNILGEKYYRDLLTKYSKVPDKYELVPLSEIKQADQIDDYYRYNYVPLLLTALESEIGKERMWKWLRAVLASKNVKTDYAFFKSSLLASGVTQKEWDNFEGKYISAKDAKENVLNVAKRLTSN